MFNAYAEETAANFVYPEEIEQTETDVTKIDFADSNEEEIDISGYIKTRGNYLVEGGILNHNDSLTTEEPTDVYFFSTTSDRTLFARLLTDSQYIVEIANVDWNSGNMYLTGVTISANQLSAIDIPEGDWALYVHSLNNLWDNPYTIQFNVTNPAAYTTAISISSDLSRCIVKKNTLYYCNGLYINLSDVKNNEVKWEFHETYPVYNPSQPTNPGTGYRDLKISNGTIMNIGYGLYKTNKTTIPNALYIKLGEKTVWSYNNSVIVDGGYERTTKDLRELDTPRLFDEIDVNGDSYGIQLLIYDLDIQKYINFYSLYNPYFTSGSEKLDSTSWCVWLE